MWSLKQFRTGQDSAANLERTLKFGRDCFQGSHLPSKTSPSILTTLWCLSLTWIWHCMTSSPSPVTTHYCRFSHCTTQLTTHPSPSTTLTVKRPATPSLAGGSELLLNKILIVCSPGSTMVAWAPHLPSNCFHNEAREAVDSFEYFMPLHDSCTFWVVFPWWN